MAVSGLLTAQQHSSHVPKFGNWDNDNVPYTAYFDNARKEKGRASVMINPNDPQENPQAFMHMRTGSEVDLSFSHNNNNKNIAAAHKSVSEEKQEMKGHRVISGTHRRNLSNQPKIGISHTSIASESGSDKSSSDYSLLQAAAYRREKSERKKGMALAAKEPNNNSNSLSTSAVLVPQHSRQRSQTRSISNGRHQRTASIPKFGAWDEADPNSGEGFTVIFSRVKEEKKLGSSAIPSVAPQPTYTYSPDTAANQAISNSSRSKLCCCLFSCGSKS